MLGKAKCKILKEIRKKIASENDIPYVTRECTYQGDCSGTCPKCEAELRYLETELKRREALGKTVAVAALCAGMAMATSGCTFPGGNTALGGDVPYDGPADTLSGNAPYDAGTQDDGTLTDVTVDTAGVVDEPEPDEVLMGKFPAPEDEIGPEEPPEELLAGEPVYEENELPEELLAGEPLPEDEIEGLMAAPEEEPEMLMGDVAYVPEETEAPEETESPEAESARTDG